MTTTAATPQAALDAKRKRFEDFRAKAAFKSWELWRTDAADGEVHYFAARWGMVRALGSSLDDAAKFLSSVGVEV